MDRKLIYQGKKSLEDALKKLKVDVPNFNLKGKKRSLIVLAIVLSLLGVAWYFLSPAPAPPDLGDGSVPTSPPPSTPSTPSPPTPPSPPTSTNVDTQNEDEDIAREDGRYECDVGTTFEEGGVISEGSLAHPERFIIHDTIFNSRPEEYTPEIIGGVHHHSYTGLNIITVHDLNKDGINCAEGWAPSTAPPKCTAIDPDNPVHVEKCSELQGHDLTDGNACGRVHEEGDTTQICNYLESTPWDNSKERIAIIHNIEDDEEGTCKYFINSEKYCNTQYCMLPDNDTLLSNNLINQNKDGLTLSNYHDNLKFELSECTAIDPDNPVHVEKCSALQGHELTDAHACERVHEEGDTTQICNYVQEQLNNKKSYFRCKDGYSHGKCSPPTGPEGMAPSCAHHHNNRPACELAGCEYEYYSDRCNIETCLPTDVTDTDTDCATGYIQGTAAEPSTTCPSGCTLHREYECDTKGLPLTCEEDAGTPGIKSINININDDYCSNICYPLKDNDSTTGDAGPVTPPRAHIPEISPEIISSDGTEAPNILSFQTMKKYNILSGSDILRFATIPQLYKTFTGSEPNQDMWNGITTPPRCTPIEQTREDIELCSSITLLDDEIACNEAGGGEKCTYISGHPISTPEISELEEQGWTSFTYNTYRDHLTSPITTDNIDYTEIKECNRSKAWTGDYRELICPGGICQFQSNEIKFEDPSNQYFDDTHPYDINNPQNQDKICDGGGNTYAIHSSCRMRTCSDIINDANSPNCSYGYMIDHTKDNTSIPPISNVDEGIDKDLQEVVNETCCIQNTCMNNDGTGYNFPDGFTCDPFEGTPDEGYLKDSKYNLEFTLPISCKLDQHLQDHIKTYLRKLDLHISDENFSVSQGCNEGDNSPCTITFINTNKSKNKLVEVEGANIIDTESGLLSLDETHPLTTLKNKIQSWHDDDDVEYSIPADQAAASTGDITKDNNGCPSTGTDSNLYFGKKLNEILTSNNTEIDIKRIDIVCEGNCKELDCCTVKTCGEYITDQGLNYCPNTENLVTNLECMIGTNVFIINNIEEIEGHDIDARVNAFITIISPKFQEIGINFQDYIHHKILKPDPLINKYILKIFVPLSLSDTQISYIRDNIINNNLNSISSQTPSNLNVYHEVLSDKHDVGECYFEKSSVLDGTIGNCCFEPVCGDYYKDYDDDTLENADKARCSTNGFKVIPSMSLTHPPQTPDEFENQCCTENPTITCYKYKDGANNTPVKQDGNNYIWAGSYQSTNNNFPESVSILRDTHAEKDSSGRDIGYNLNDVNDINRDIITCSTQQDSGEESNQIYLKCINNPNFDENAGQTPINAKYYYTFTGCIDEHEKICRVPTITEYQSARYNLDIANVSGVDRFVSVGDLDSTSRAYSYTGVTCAGESITTGQASEIAENTPFSVGHFEKCSENFGLIQIQGCDYTRGADGQRYNYSYYKDIEAPTDIANYEEICNKYLGDPIINANILNPEKNLNNISCKIPCDYSIGNKGGGSDVVCTHKQDSHFSNITPNCEDYSELTADPAEEKERKERLCGEYDNCTYQGGECVKKSSGAFDNLCEPGYYYRGREEGEYSKGAGECNVPDLTSCITNQHCEWEGHESCTAMDTTVPADVQACSAVDISGSDALAKQTACGLAGNCTYTTGRCIPKTYDFQYDKCTPCTDISNTIGRNIRLTDGEASCPRTRINDDNELDANLDFCLETTTRSGRSPRYSYTDEIWAKGNTTLDTFQIGTHFDVPGAESGDYFITKKDLLNRNIACDPDPDPDGERTIDEMEMVYNINPTYDGVTTKYFKEPSEKCIGDLTSVEVSNPDSWININDINCQVLGDTVGKCMDGGEEQTVTDEPRQYITELDPALSEEEINLRKNECLQNPGYTFIIDKQECENNEKHRCLHIESNKFTESSELNSNMQMDARYKTENIPELQEINNQYEQIAKDNTDKSYLRPCHRTFGNFLVNDISHPGNPCINLQDGNWDAPGGRIDRYSLEESGDEGRPEICADDHYLVDALENSWEDGETDENNWCPTEPKTNEIPYNIPALSRWDENINCPHWRLHTFDYQDLDKPSQINISDRRKLSKIKCEKCGEGSLSNFKNITVDNEDKCVRILNYCSVRSDASPAAGVSRKQNPYEATKQITPDKMQDPKYMSTSKRLTEAVKNNYPSLNDIIDIEVCGERIEDYDWDGRGDEGAKSYHYNHIWRGMVGGTGDYGSCPQYDSKFYKLKETSTPECKNKEGETQTCDLAGNHLWGAPLKSFTCQIDRANLAAGFHPYCGTDAQCPGNRPERCDTSGLYPWSETGGGLWTPHDGRSSPLRRGGDGNEESARAPSRQGSGTHNKPGQDDRGNNVNLDYFLQAYKMGNCWGLTADDTTGNWNCKVARDQSPRGDKEGDHLCAPGLVCDDNCVFSDLPECYDCELP